MDTKGGRQHQARRFYFDKRMLEVPDFQQVVNQAWNIRQTGTPMFQVCARIKECRLALLKLRGMQNLNSSKAIRDIKGQMKDLQRVGGNRDWIMWNQL